MVSLRIVVFDSLKGIPSTLYSSLSYYSSRILSSLLLHVFTNRLPTSWQYVLSKEEIPIILREIFLFLHNIKFLYLTFMLYLPRSHTQFYLIKIKLSITFETIRSKQNSQAGANNTRDNRYREVRHRKSYFLRLGCFKDEFVCRFLCRGRFWEEAQDDSNLFVRLN